MTDPTTTTGPADPSAAPAPAQAAAAADTSDAPEAPGATPPAPAPSPDERATAPAPSAPALRPPDYRPLIDEGWHEQACWSTLAGQLKQRLDLWRQRAAVLSVLGAALVTAAAQLKGLAPEAGGGTVGAAASVLSLLAGGVLALAPLIVQRFAAPEHVSAWTRARAVSEAWKSQLYRLLVATAQPDAAVAAAAAFVRRTEAARAAVPDLSPQAAAQHPATKARPSALSLDDYIAQRLLGQCNDYYGPAAQREAAQAQRLRAWATGLASLAAALTWASGPLTTQLPALGDWVGALAAGLPALAPWAAVATGAGLAVTAHLAAARHDTQANLYRATAQRLRGAHKLWSVSPSRYSAAEAAALVDEVEAAITTENGAWLADWGKGTETS